MRIPKNMPAKITTVATSLLWKIFPYFLASRRFLAVGCSVFSWPLCPIFYDTPFRLVSYCLKASTSSDTYM